MLPKIYDEIISYFPEEIKKCFEIIDNNIWSKASEIHIRSGQAITIKLFGDEVLIKHIVKNEDIIRIVENFSDSSIYAIQREINNGFITIKGGHRIGISGTSIFENGIIKNIKYISSLNIRIAREVKNCSLKIFDKIYKNGFENTLIVSPPGCGKTTLLRDMIRILSNGIGNMKGKTIALIDERSEISAMYMGMPQNDIGFRTDVMNNCIKSVGIKMMIRSMGPDIIATDEIGGDNDISAIYDAVFSGVKLLLTAHGSDINDVPNELLRLKLFSNIIFLKKCEMPGIINKIFVLEGDNYAIAA